MARQVIQDAIKFSATMLQLSTDDGIDPTFNPKTQKHANHNRHHLSISANFPYVKNAFPTTVILPLQDSLTCTLPSSAETVKTHNPFPDGFVTIKGEIFQPCRLCSGVLTMIGTICRDHGWR